MIHYKRYKLLCRVSFSVFILLKNRAKNGKNTFQNYCGEAIAQ